MPPPEVLKLREELKSLGLRGERLRSFDGMDVMERAFFPGGHGLYQGAEGRFPVDQTLVLGSNFGCVSNFIYANGKLRCPDETDISPTWKNLRPLLRKAGIPLEGCFFSNVFPVLHEDKQREDAEDSKTNILDARLVAVWLSNRCLVESFQRFYEMTLNQLKPRLVIALGFTFAATFLNATWPPEQCDRWRRVRASGTAFPKVTGRDLSRLPVLSISAGQKYVCTAIPHPSDKRNWSCIEGYKGEHGIVQLLKEAARRAGINFIQSEIE